MKKILSVLLIAACVLALGSCEILKQFLSVERVETDVNANVTIVDPDSEGIEDQLKGEEGVKQTTPNEEKVTTPDQNDPQEPQTQKITVEVKFQSGGVHAYQENVTVDAPATFSQVYNLFVAMHEDIKSYRLDCYLNDQKIDPSQTIYVNNGDRIYLQESGASLDEEYPCIHVWFEGVCTQCGNACMHETWGDNGQCLACGFWMGVNLLEIEIHENGEFRYFAGGCLQTTVQELMLAYYGPYPWDYWESTYGFYFNGVLVTDGSYMITENGILNLVTRNY